jgi:hypothetical protein
MKSNITGALKWCEFTTLMKSSVKSSGFINLKLLNFKAMMCESLCCRHQSFWKLFNKLSWHYQLRYVKGRKFRKRKSFEFICNYPWSLFELVAEIFYLFYFKNFIVTLNLLILWVTDKLFICFPYFFANLYFYDFRIIFHAYQRWILTIFHIKQLYNLIQTIF